MSRIAILQPNYIPWKGVFDMINMVDTLVFLDDVDFTKQDWRTRNKIKSPNNEVWLSVPVNKVSLGTKIFDVTIQKNGWQRKHYNTFIHNYSKSPFLKDYKFLLDDFYLQREWESLSEMNIYFCTTISEILGIKTKFCKSSDFDASGKKTDKLIDICRQLKATHYLSGPAAKNYIENSKFEKESIALEYITYDYPEYPQLFGAFNHFVTTLDVLFNCGETSHQYIFQSKIE